jgi:hypothetical protein
MSIWLLSLWSLAKHVTLLARAVLHATPCVPGFERAVERPASWQHVSCARAIYLIKVWQLRIKDDNILLNDACDHSEMQTNHQI